MSFDTTKTEFTPYSRYQHFSFFESVGADGSIAITLNPEKIFQIKELRLHFSAAFPSVADLVLRISAAKGSAHNIILFSKAMNGSTDVFWYPSTASNTLQFLSDDHFIISLPVVSGVVLGGINLQGWTIEG